MDYQYDDDAAPHARLLAPDEKEAGPPASSSCPATSTRRRSLAIIALLLSLLLVLTCLTPRQWARSRLPWTTEDAHGGLASLPSASEKGDTFLLGVGKADITGPVVEINMAGYADPKQVGTGLRQRLYSRAFIVADAERPEDRFVYLVLDTQAGDTAVRYGVLSRLAGMGPEYAAYGHHNLALTGTHSHAGPGGWFNYLLPQITSKGFDHQGYQAIVEGVALSIRRAHESLQPGYLGVGSAKLYGANINRSLFAYLANPEEERARYNASVDDDGSVERELTLLKFQRASDGKDIGVLTWFPTHGTSLLGNNTLIAADNKGVAAYLFEQSVRGGDRAAEGFVAGFSQAGGVGDSSPNVLGAWCEDGTGSMCSFENSTCSDGRSQMCHARGPLFRADDNGASSCFEVGRRQFESARALYDRLGAEPNPVRGPWVRSVHTFHDMSDFGFVLPNGTAAHTCPAALGYSFAAGTSDGPGAFSFRQHVSDPSNTSPVWNVVSRLLRDPTDAQRACHHPKPILLDVGEMGTPYQWTPNVVDVQVFRAGQLLIIVSPGEATTMAGRRWKDAVRSDAALLFETERQRPSASSSSASSAPSAPSPVVVLGGPANSYTHYITTEQEYGIQRYEGASTLYGPHTLAAYVNVSLSLLPYLSAPAAAPPPPPHAGGIFPPDNSNRSLSFITGVVRDGTPLGRAFGDVLSDTRRLYRRSSRARAVFVGANPRNDLRLERTYAAVEKLRTPSVAAAEELEAYRRSEKGGEGEHWDVVRDDSDWSLVFAWRRTSEIMATSEAEVVWETEPAAEPGVYRLRYFGDAKSIMGTITPFEGASGAFTLV